MKVVCLREEVSKELILFQPLNSKQESWKLFQPSDRNVRIHYVCKWILFSKVSEHLSQEWSCEILQLAQLFVHNTSMKISLLKSSLEVGGKFFYLVTTVSHIILPIFWVKPFHVFIDWIWKSRKAFLKNYSDFSNDFVSWQSFYER